MNSKINLRKIILASSSPRRFQLMQDSGFWFEQRQFDFVETYPNDLPAFKVAQFIAEQKSNHAIHSIAPNEILLTADSIVVLNDKVFGKPADFDEAYNTLAHLSGKKHLVYTGVCLQDQKRKISFTGTSEVYVRPLNHEEICWYIAQHKPFDKAGAYAVQEWIGLCKISEIRGTQANIMGLPTDLVYEGLKTFDGALVFPQ